jgi:hypothetical protein
MKSKVSLNSLPRASGVPESPQDTPAPDAFYNCETIRATIRNEKGRLIPVLIPTIHPDGVSMLIDYTSDPGEIKAVYVHPDGSKKYQSWGLEPQC